MSGDARPEASGGMRSDLLQIVDATLGRWGTKPGRYALRFAALSQTDDDTDHPSPEEAGEGAFDPLCLKLHDMRKELDDGTPDRRFSIATVNDWDGGQEPPEEGESVYAQADDWTAQNRSTREVDTQGRSAIPSSLRRIVDSPDGRHALALVCPGPKTEAPESAIAPSPEDGEGQWPVGVRAFEAGSGGAGTAGGVRFNSGGISIGGVTFFGGAAVQAANAARQAGGSIADIARAASAGVTGSPQPELRDNQTRVRTPAPPEPARNNDPAPLWDQMDRPGGYVADGQRIGLLGTILTLASQQGRYAVGSEGTPIGNAAIRHDAHFAADGLTGALKFDSQDVSGIPSGTGRLFKGAMFADSSLANTNTQVGNESVKWLPAVYVDAAIPSGRPSGVTYVDVRPPNKPKPGKPGKGPQPLPGGGGSGGSGSGGGSGGGGGKPRKGRGEPGGGSDPLIYLPVPSPGAAAGSSSGFPGVYGGLSRVGPRTAGASTDADGEPGAVTNPSSQTRDLTGSGAPCPNLTAGRAVKSRNPHGTMTTPDGVTRDHLGHPAVLTNADGTISLGGVEAAAPLVLIGDGSSEEAAQGLRREGGGPDDRVFPVGLPGGKNSPIQVDPSPGAIPRGAEERRDKRRRREAAERRANEEEKADQELIDKRRRAADEIESQADAERELGNERRADWLKARANRIRRNADKAQKRLDGKKSRRQRRKDYVRKRRARTAARRKAYADRKARNESRRKAKRAEKDRDAGVIEIRSDGAFRMPVAIGQEEPGSEDTDPGWTAGAIAGGSVGKWGSWNVANRPLKDLGEAGGPTTVQDWCTLATATTRALQRTITGAFGGPEFLNSNLAVVEENREGKALAGNLLGQTGYSYEGETVTHGEGDGGPLTIISTMAAEVGSKIVAGSNGILNVVREKRGGGTVVDNRPAILIENDRGHSKRRNLADHIANIARTFAVNGKSGVQATGLGVHVASGAASGLDSGNLLEVGKLPSQTQGLSGAGLTETFLRVDADGLTSVSRELNLAALDEAPDAPEAGAVVYTRGGTPYIRAADGDEIELSTGAHTTAPPTVTNGGGTFGGGGILGTVTLSADRTHSGQREEYAAFTDGGYTQTAALGYPFQIACSGAYTRTGLVDGCARASARADDTDGETDPSRGEPNAP